MCILQTYFCIFRLRVLDLEYFQANINEEIQDLVSIFFPWQYGEGFEAIFRSC